MRLKRVICLGALLTLRIVPAPGQSSALFPDPGSLAAELRRLEKMEEEGQGSQVSASVPPSWFVESSGRRYAISSEPLRLLDRSPEQARDWLDQLAGELENYPTAPQNPSSARGQLDHILARREFSGVKPPGPLELLFRRISEWIQSLLRRLFGFGAQHPTAGTVLFWTLAVAAMGFVGGMLYRLWTGRGQSTPAESEPAAIPARTYRQWILLAREAAERGGLRRAIQCAYWAGVVRLQDEGLLPEDLTRTPREYLRLLPEHASSRAPMASLTSALERFWYAGRAAGADDLRESFRNLEVLGCQVD